MLSDEKQPEPWQQSLKMISKCPVCGCKYDTKTAKLFLKKSTAQLVHITCNKCEGYFVAMVMTFGHGISTVGMVTDLSFDDMKRMNHEQALEIDDVIVGHQMINNSDFIQII